MDTIHRKYEDLQAQLRALGSVAVAFSGGVDSTFLLRVAHDVLGDRAVALTAVSPTFPRREREETISFCRENGIPQRLLPVDVVQEPCFRTNPPDRCYHCKRAIFTLLGRTARELGLAAVAEGSNMDDLGDYRPGLAAVAELGVLSPLRQAGLTKGEIRALSQELGLPTWDKPSYACLASRFVYGESITQEKLERVGRGEELLQDLGFRQVRVRLHGDLARIELLPEDLDRLLSPELRERVYRSLREIGFPYVTVDLGGYRTGSMNELLPPQAGKTGKKSF